MIQHPNIIQNKYYRLYLRIIESNIINESEYNENHHILPRSLGGTDIKSNLVRLSSRRHFLLHYLLTKFTINQALYSCRKAFNMMKAGRNYQYRYFNSRLYESNRKHMSETMSLSQSGKTNSQYGKIWMYNIITNIPSKFYISDINEALEQGWIFGRNGKYKFINPNPKTINRIISPKDFKTMGAQIKIYSPYGYEMQIREIYFCDYAIDGWIKINPEKQSTRKRTYLTNGIDNIIIPIDFVTFLTKYGKWKLGFYNPNHKGTTGKTYHYVDNERVYD